MGMVHVTLTIRPLQKSRKKYEATFLVDTESTDCMVPASALQRIGIRKRGRSAYELANGDLVEYDFGLAEIDYKGEVTSGRVLFAEEGCEPIMGVTALESLGYTVIL